PIVRLCINYLGTLLCSLCGYQTLKIFDILVLDMITMVKLDFIPLCSSFVYSSHQSLVTLVISDKLLTAIDEQALSSLFQSTIFHTTYSDIHLRLFLEFVPKTSKNLIQHSKQSYYNKYIFHRVIKQFMIQRHDPLRNETCIQSIRGKRFPDKFYPQLKHNSARTLSMANAGSNTNKPQFFITIVP
ncbi:unnamed protein product, partial [Rotaria sordida]